MELFQAAWNSDKVWNNKAFGFSSSVLIAFWKLPGSGSTTVKKENASRQSNYGLIYHTHFCSSPLPYFAFLFFMIPVLLLKSGV